MIIVEMETKEGEDKREAAERCADADIETFDAFLQKTTDAAPLTRFEKAIIKTYLIHKLLG